jgi:hypothetical protein
MAVTLLQERYRTYSYKANVSEQVFELSPHIIYLYHTLPA